MTSEEVWDNPEYMVLVSEKALSRLPGSMAFHVPGRYDPEYGQLTVCLMTYEWLSMRRDLAELIGRPCKVCQQWLAANKARIRRSLVDV